jgi:hypothetical protein
VFYADEDVSHYGDGRSVVRRLSLGDGRQYVHAWHPDPFQNTPPQEICTLTMRDGTRKAIIVSAPGILDSLTVTRPERR